MIDHFLRADVVGLYQIFWRLKWCHVLYLISYFKKKVVEMVLVSGRTVSFESPEFKTCLKWKCPDMWQCLKWRVIQHMLGLFCLHRWLIKQTLIQECLLSKVLKSCTDIKCLKHLNIILQWCKEQLVTLRCFSTNILTFDILFLFKGKTSVTPVEFLLYLFSYLQKNLTPVGPEKTSPFWTFYKRSICVMELNVTCLKCLHETFFIFR